MFLQARCRAVRSVGLVALGGDAGGCSSMVEQKPSKLTTRVRFPSPAPIQRVDRKACVVSVGVLAGSRMSF